MAASGNVPATETFKATAIGVSVTLPSDWGGEPGGKSGVRYEVVAPGNVEILSIYMTATSESLSALAPQLTALVRKQGVGSDGLKVASKTTTLGLDIPAVEVSVSYHGLFPQGPAEVGEVRHDIYFAVHAGVLYEFTTVALTRGRRKTLA
jgi:hypothetical protein